MKRTARHDRRLAIKPKSPAPSLSSCTVSMSIRKHVESVRLHSRHPPVSVDELALMLEIDLALGRRGDFIKRLQKALDAASFSGGQPS